jgi:hypothetical protein
MEDFESGYTEGALEGQPVGGENTWATLNGIGMDIGLTNGNPGVAAIYPTVPGPKFDRSFIVHNESVQDATHYQFAVDAYLDPNMLVEAGIRDNAPDDGTGNWLLMCIYHHYSGNTGFRLETSLGDILAFGMDDVITTQWYRMELDWMVGGDATITVLDSFGDQLYQATKDVSAFLNPENMTTLSIAGESLPGNPTNGTVAFDNLSFGPMLVPIVPGDYNKNGVVDAADYVAWRKLNGQSGAGLAADGDNDGSVDSDDYLFWRARFDNTTGSGISASSAVPEPTGIALILIMMPLTFIVSAMRNLRK